LGRNQEGIQNLLTKKSGKRVVSRDQVVSMREADEIRKRFRRKRVVAAKSSGRTGDAAVSGKRTHWNKR